MKDLLVLTADNNMKSAVEGILERQPSLGITVNSYKVIRHPDSDPGCVKNAHAILRQMLSLYRYCLVMFDYEGSGQENKRTPGDLETEVRTLLEKNGWSGRADVVVIVPELEQWFWVPELSHIKTIMNCRDLDIVTWLQKHGYWEIGQNKPIHPKDALQKIAWKCRKPRSSSIYKDMALCASLSSCEDKAFIRFRDILQRWFGGLQDTESGH